MARRRRSRFGVPTVFAGRPSVGEVGLGCQAIRFAAAARFGALGGVLPDGVLSDSKSPRRKKPIGIPPINFRTRHDRGRRTHGTARYRARSP